MLEESIDFAEDDVHQRMLRECRVDAEGILHATRVQLAKHAVRLAEEERAVIDAAMIALERAAAGDYPIAIRDAYDHLSQTSEPFARRIMDAALQESVGGRVIEDL